MLKLSIAEIAVAVGGEIGPSAEAADSIIPTGYSIDTRTLAAGDLFFALEGEHTDGHRFVGDACARGAAGAVVARPAEGLGASFAQVVVESPLRALQDLAIHVRSLVDIPVVGVTGSNGKTTTKEMMAAVLSSKYRVHKNPGNYNNRIGVPLTILGLDESAELLVTELGSNHMGEIMELARWTKPCVGVVTNAGRAHIGLFGSLENVVREKTDLLRALPPSGRGVVNADSPAVLQSAKEIDIDTVTFGIKAECDFRAVDIRSEGAGIAARGERGGCGAATAGPGIVFTVGETEVRLRAPGVHNIYNALAAIATGTLFDVAPSEAARILEEFEPIRVAIHTGGGVMLIDDTYNANPDSVRAVLSLLTSAPAERKILVLGEMLELGEFSVELHREVGAEVASAGVDYFFGVGGAVRDAVDAARQAGMSEGDAAFFADKEAACGFLSRFVRSGDAVLVKGSRATGMDQVSDFLRTSLVFRRN